MMTTVEQVQSWLEAGLDQAQIEVSGDGRHFEAKIISAQFEGKNTLLRHRMVYAALGDKMDEAIHALSLVTLTPNES